MKEIQDCATQPLHLFERVQSYAYFIRFNRQLDIEAHSNQSFLTQKLNLEFDKRNAKGGINSLTLFQLLDKPSIVRIEKAISNLRLNQMLRVSFKDSTVSLHAYLYRVESSFHLEIEPEEYLEQIRKHKQQTRWTRRFHDCVLKISSATDRSEALKAVTDFLSEVVGYDRTMIYQFMSDDHGIVIEETLMKDWEPYLGLHYPESDIPIQARDLYFKNKSRIILERDAEDVSIIRTEMLSSQEIDLTDSSARSVAPIHIEYLKNMGVRSSASFSLIHEGVLWGLISCHHGESFYLGYRDRSLIYSLGQILMARLTQIERKDEIRAANKASQLVLEILSFLSVEQLAEDENKAEQFKIAFKKYGDQVLGITDSTSFIAHLNDETVVIGKALSQQFLGFVDGYLSTRHEFLTAVESLKDIGAVSDSLLDEGVGFLALSSDQPHSKNYLAWVRPRYEEQIRWAGRDEKVLSKTNGVMTLHPRASFKEYLEIRKDKSKPWSPADRESALQFTQFFSSVLSSFWRQSQGLVNKLQEVDRVKDSFIGMVSHELRTPLNNILGWVQIIQNNRSLSDQVRHGVDVIRANAENQALIVNDLLDFSRIMQGKLQIELERLCLTHLIREVVESLKPTLAIKSQSIVAVLEEDLFVMGDADRIKQVYWNLLHNAIKFSGSQARIEVVAKDDGFQIYTEVIDQGEGIEKDQLNLVFQKFYQTQSGSQRRHKGLGLGLAIVKSIVDHHAGEIGAFSEGSGKGAKFVVTFPKLSKSESVSAIGAEPDELINLNARVLLIEDNDDSREFMTMGLQYHGLKIVSFGEATSAINYLKSDYAFDVILSDIGLPEMDGHQFRRALRSNAEANKIPSIALTAHTTKADIEKALNSGFSTHLAKPVKMSEVLSAIRHLINK